MGVLPRPARLRDGRLQHLCAMGGIAARREGLHSAPHCPVQSLKLPPLVTNRRGRPTRLGPFHEILSRLRLRSIRLHSSERPPSNERSSLRKTGDTGDKRVDRASPPTETVDTRISSRVWFIDRKCGVELVDQGQRVRWVCQLLFPETPMLPSIPETFCQVSAEDPMALTRVLDLPEMMVVGLEYSDISHWSTATLIRCCMLCAPPLVVSWIES